MTWKGESRRHSLARRGIRTADIKFAYGNYYDDDKNLRESSAYRTIKGEKPKGDELFQIMIDNIGETEIDEGMYILPNGKTLSFYGVKLHKDIEKLGFSMYDFLREGGIRYGLQSNITGGYSLYFDYYMEMSNSQKRIISQLIKDYEPRILVTVYDDHREEYPYIYYESFYDEGTKPSKLFMELNNLYE